MSDGIANIRAQAERDALYAATRAVLSAEDFLSAARSIVEYCCEVTTATCGYVALVSEDGEKDEVVFLSLGGQECTLNPELPMPIRGLRSEAYRANKVMYDNDFENSEWQRNMPQGHVPIRNVLFAPLNLHGQTVGLIGIANKPAMFDEHDAELARIFGEIASVALQNHRTLEKLKKSEEKFARSFDGSPLIMTITEIETGRYIDANRQFFLTSGYTPEECLGKTSVDLGFISDETRTALKKELWEKGAISERECKAIRKDGQLMYLRYFGEFIEYDGRRCLLSCAQDVTHLITERRRNEFLEQKLARARKLEAMGVLAAKIARGFQGMIDEVSDCVNELSNAIYQDEHAITVTRLRAATANAQNAVHKLSALGNISDGTHTESSPVEVLADMVRIFRASVPDNVEIEEHYSFAGGTIMASASQLHRALMNVLTNSLNAMTDAGGAIWICIAENNDVSQEIRSQMRQSSARICEITISDTGCGIAGEHLEHIFEPFFSNGSDSKNAGMGLAVTYRIIHEIGGAIDVESTPGEGTSFHVYLPVIQPPTRETAGDGVGIGPERSSSPIHVLFVDDEQMICSVARGMLKHLGFQATTFQRSFEALAAFRNQPEMYDVVISDQTMPGMTGLEIVSEIRDINDEIPIILCSGYTNLIDVDVMNRLRIFTLLEKPFTRETLGNAVSAALHQRRTGSWKE